MIAVPNYRTMPNESDEGQNLNYSRRSTEDPSSLWGKDPGSLIMLSQQRMQDDKQRETYWQEIASSFD